MAIEDFVTITNIRSIIDEAVQTHSSLPPEGGKVKVDGTGFGNGMYVLFNNSLLASSRIFLISSTEVDLVLPPAAPASYNLQIVGANGTNALKIRSITYTPPPTWVTAAMLTSQVSNKEFGIQLEATSATTYRVTPGFSLPTGIALTSNGVLSGSVNNIASATILSFQIDAVSAVGVFVTRVFSLPITPPVVSPTGWIRTSLRPTYLATQSPTKLVNIRTNTTAFRAILTSGTTNSGQLWVSSTGGRSGWVLQSGATTAVTAAGMVGAVSGPNDDGIWVTVIASGYSTLTAARIITSTDLNVWTRRTVPALFTVGVGFVGYIRVQSGPLAGPLFVGMGAGGRAMTSRDAINWVYRGGLFTHPTWGAQNIPSYAFATNDNIVMCGGALTARVAWSTDGINWNVENLKTLINWPVRTEGADTTESIGEIVWNGRAFIVRGTAMQMAVARPNTNGGLDWSLSLSLENAIKQTEIEFNGIYKNSGRILHPHNTLSANETTNVINYFYNLKAVSGTTTTVRYFVFQSADDGLTWTRSFVTADLRTGTDAMSMAVGTSANYPVNSINWPNFIVATTPTGTSAFKGEIYISNP